MIFNMTGGSGVAGSGTGAGLNFKVVGGTNADTLPWNGDTTGLTAISDDYGTYYKVSDKINIFDNPYNYRYSVYNNTLNSKQEYSASASSYSGYQAIYTQSSALGIIIITSTTNDYDNAEIGIYFQHNGESWISSLTVPDYDGFYIRADKENTIWVKTDTEITSWTFSATEPENPVEGMVWILTGALSPVEFNAVKKNNIMVYPTSAYQYINGVWVSKDVKIYQNGWMDWTTYLYYEGNEYTAITGGFSKTFVNSYGTGTLKKNSDSLYLTSTGVSGSGNHITVATANKIDLSNYSTLYARIKFTNSKYTRCYLAAHTSNNVSPSSGDCELILSSSVDDVVSLDVSNLSGSYYIWVGLAGSQGSNSGNCYVYEVYLK